MRAVLLMLLLTGCATVQDMDRSEQAWHTLNLIDGIETAGFCSNIRELNPLLGEHPSNAEVAVAIAAFSLGYHYVRRWIKDQHPDGLRAFDTITLTIKGLVVLHNYALIRREC